MSMTTTELKALAKTGSLSWEHEDDMGGEWIRHDIGNGIDAILHDDEELTNNPTILLLTISRYESGEVLVATRVSTIKEAETMIGTFNATQRPKKPRPTTSSSSATATARGARQRPTTRRWRTTRKPQATSSAVSTCGLTMKTCLAKHGDTRWESHGSIPSNAPS